MRTHEEIIAEWMKNPEFKKGYDALEEEFAAWDRETYNKEDSDDEN